MVHSEPRYFWTTSVGFEATLRTRLEEWISGIADDVQRTGGPKKLLARGASVGVNAAGIGVMLATFAHTGGLTGTEVGVAAATGFLNQKLLEALFGEAALVEMIQRARANLAAAISASFDEELARYERLVPDGDSLRTLAVELRAAAKDVAELQPPDAFEADARVAILIERGGSTDASPAGPYA